jgi:2-polyprenyl-3-methyl-5-hydroxy-6-metoxy-1,4-benzoquinol methylase
MELATAIKLLEKGAPDPKAQVWGDLGAGAGLFTQALSTLLGDGSLIYAMDLKISSPIKPVKSTVRILEAECNFITDELEGGPFDGLLMANSLHFVADKKSFLKKLRRNVKPNGVLLVVEYDMDTANNWVPYPVSFQTLKGIVSDDFTLPERLASVPSVYHRAVIYSALSRVK